MTNQPPPNPGSSSDSELGFDDFIGILVAFLTIGTVLFWSLSRKETNWNFANLSSNAPVGSNVPLRSDDDNNLNDLTALLVPSPEPNNNLKYRQPVTEAEPRRRNPVLLERRTDNAVIPPFLVPPVRRVPPDYDRVTGNNTNNAGLNVGEDKLKPIEAPVVVEKPTPTQAATPTQTPTPQAKATKPPTIPPAKDFDDVPAGYWAKPFIDTLSSRQIIAGKDKNTFEPQQPVTRAEFAAIIDQAFKTDLTNSNRSFADVPADFWAQNQIKNAVDKKFMKGYNANTFRPNQRIPRVEVIAALVSGLNKTLKTPESQDQALSVYKDADQIPEWAREQVAIATANGLIVNHPDRNFFRPKEDATRAEVTTMIYQALVKMDKVEPIKSQYVINQ
ncbi:S-layer homology domain-containing protein [Calothrix sp. CCY 0018]|uniref:S-layer homology domain-containing protein n=1 Tax=Calothrix sp. CCY 0018 TaxID=3103864 RepID=UPI0039C62B48